MRFVCRGGDTENNKPEVVPDRQNRGGGMRIGGLYLLVFTLCLMLPVICFTAAIQVNMNDSAFDPDSLTIDQGDTVPWINQATTEHRTTSGLPFTADRIWDSGLMVQNDSFTYLFEDPGDYLYFCMLGSVAGMTRNAEVNTAQLGCIKGVVEDTDSNSLEGALVEAFESWVVMGADTTDSTGLYEMWLLDGTYDAVASKGGYRPDTATGILILSGTCSFQDFLLEPVSVECGDVNADGKVTFADALYVKNYYYQTPPGSPAPIRQGDVNLDGYVTFADALYLKNYYYQTPPESPAPCER